MEAVINFLKHIDTRIVMTVVTVITIIVVKHINSKFITKQINTKSFSHIRKDNILKLFNVIYGVAFMAIIIIIWGIKGEDIIIFTSSILTVVGVGFFAQWSVLSNITSGIILFFSGNLKIGDEIVIMDKDYPIEGRIDTIGIFFTEITTVNNGRVSIPNVVLMQKVISYK